MMQFRKKAPPPMLAWHPDFRDPETLPDVKPVRTAFFINGAAILLLAVVAIYLAFLEYGRHGLRQEIQLLEQRIQEHKGQNEEALKLHRAFQAEERSISEIARFLDHSLPVSELLMAISETLHPNMTFSAIRYQDISDRGKAGGKELLLNGAIKATPDAAASVMTEYLEAFERHPFLANLVAEAVPTSLVPAPEGDLMGFGIRLKLKDEQTEKKGDQK